MASSDHGAQFQTPIQAANGSLGIAVPAMSNPLTTTAITHAAAPIHNHAVSMGTLSHQPVIRPPTTAIAHDSKQVSAGSAPSVVPPMVAAGTQAARPELVAPTTHATSALATQRAPTRGTHGRSRRSRSPTTSDIAQFMTQMPVLVKTKSDSGSGSEGSPEPDAQGTAVDPPSIMEPEVGAVNAPVLESPAVMIPTTVATPTMATHSVATVPPTSTGNPAPTTVTTAAFAATPLLTPGTAPNMRPAPGATPDPRPAQDKQGLPNVLGMMRAESMAASLVASPTSGSSQPTDGRPAGAHGPAVSLPTSISSTSTAAMGTGGENGDPPGKRAKRRGRKRIASAVQWDSQLLTCHKQQYQQWLAENAVRYPTDALEDLRKARRRHKNAEYQRRLRERKAARTPPS